MPWIDLRTKLFWVIIWCCYLGKGWGFWLLGIMYDQAVNAKVEASGILLEYFSTFGVSSYNDMPNNLPFSPKKPKPNLWWMLLTIAWWKYFWGREMKTLPLLTLHLWGQDCSSEAGSGASPWVASAIHIQIEHRGMSPCCSMGLSPARGFPALRDSISKRVHVWCVFWFKLWTAADSKNCCWAL